MMWTKLSRLIPALVALFYLTPAPAFAADAGRARPDPQLLGALRAEAALRPCDCILAALWIDQSYPKIVVNVARWRRLGSDERTRFKVVALKVAETVYAHEWGTPDIYGELFIVDPAGKAL